MWIVDCQSELGSSIALNVQLGETGEKIMESPAVNLMIRPFSKKILVKSPTYLLNKYLETVT